jgi:hypothetical protein
VSYPNRPGFHSGSFQQGYFTYLQVVHHDHPVQLTPQVSTRDSASPEAEEENYSYYVRLISSKKKSDFVVRFYITNLHR